MEPNQQPEEINLPVVRKVKIFVVCPSPKPQNDSITDELKLDPALHETIKQIVNGTRAKIRFYKDGLSSDIVFRVSAYETHYLSRSPVKAAATFLSQHCTHRDQDGVYSVRFLVKEPHTALLFSHPFIMWKEITGSQVEIKEKMGHHVVQINGMKENVHATCWGLINKLRDNFFH